MAQDRAGKTIAPTSAQTDRAPFGCSGALRAPNPHESFTSAGRESSASPFGKGRGLRGGDSASACLHATLTLAPLPCEWRGEQTLGLRSMASTDLVAT